jgi:hypothetical protein
VTTIEGLVNIHEKFIFTSTAQQKSIALGIKVPRDHEVYVSIFKLTIL